MNKIVASVGLAAIGTAGMQSAAGIDLTLEGAKPWSVSASLRGFYDDNVNSLPSGYPLAHRSTFGVSVSPSMTLELKSPQTTFDLGYTLSWLLYQKRPLGNTDNYDLDHTFNVSLDHTISERTRFNVRDSFVVGQEPDTLRAGNVFNSFQRLPGNNIRNYGSITVDQQLTPEMGLEAGYANAFYDYRSINGGAPPSGVSAPDLAGLLNRVESTFHVDLRWEWQPETVVIAGYQFLDADYLANERIDGPITTPEPPVFSRSRDNHSQYGYLGLDHTFRPDLTGSVRAGARYNDYYNDPTSQSEPSPYAMASLRYAYQPESYVEVGGSYDRSATDLFSVARNAGGGIESITTDAQDAAFWVSANHRITPKIYGTLVAQVQSTTYNGGTLDSDTDLYYLVGLTLEYRFNPHVSIQAGYNYDRLDASTGANALVNAEQGTPYGRSFDRNRVFLGVTASY